MGAPKGNKNALGHDGRGTGRGSLLKECAKVDDLEAMWKGTVSREEIEEKIKSGKYGARDVFWMKVLAGKEAMLAKLLDKLYASKTENQQIINVEEMRTLENKLDEVLNGEGDNQGEKVS